MKHFYIPPLFLLVFAHATFSMDSIPNEVVRMFFEHMSDTQRYALARTCRVWNFLVSTFKKPISEKFVQSGYCTKENRDGFIGYLISNVIDNYKPYLSLNNNADKNNLHVKLSCSPCSSYNRSDFTLLDEQAREQNCQIKKFNLCEYPGGIAAKTECDSLLKTVSIDPRITSLAIGFKNETVAKYFFESLCKRPQVTKLDLCSYRIEYLVHNKSIDSVELGIRLTDLVPYECKIVHDSLTNSGDGFSLIRRWKLWGCTDGFCDTVAQMIKHNKNIEELELTGGTVSATGALKIVNALQANNTVTQIDLKHNKINEAFIKKYQDDKRLTFV